MHFSNNFKNSVFLIAGLLLGASAIAQIMGSGQ